MGPCCTWSKKMADYVQVAWYANLARRAMHRERVFRKRVNPLDQFDDIDFQRRYSFTRETTLYLINMLIPDLVSVYGCENDITPAQQVCLALRFYATGSFQRVAGELHGLSVSSTCCIVIRVSSALASRKPLYILMAGAQAENKVKQDFQAIAGFPAVIGAIIIGAFAMLLSASIGLQDPWATFAPFDVSLPFSRLIRPYPSFFGGPYHVSVWLRTSDVSSPPEAVRLIKGWSTAYFERSLHDLIRPSRTTLRLPPPPPPTGINTGGIADFLHSELLTFQGLLFPSFGIGNKPNPASL